ncbi:MAG: endonuclease domain-containing protein [Candidatus Zixiibacteriota bacterium]
MTKLYNINHLKKRRKALRNNATSAEQCLWHKLKSKQLFDLRFRRQYSIGKYVLDFYLPSHRLAIEIDGPTHISAHQKNKDRIRMAFLKSCGIHILRFTNNEVYDNIDGVLQIIIDYTKANAY